MGKKRCINAASLLRPAIARVRRRLHGANMAIPSHQYEEKSAVAPILKSNSLWNSSQHIVFAPSYRGTSHDQRWNPSTPIAFSHSPVSDQYRNRTFSTVSGGLENRSKLGAGSYNQRPTVTKNKVRASQDFEEIEFYREKFEKERKQREKALLERKRSEEAERKRAQEEASRRERERIEMVAWQREQNERRANLEQERLILERRERLRREFALSFDSLTADVATVHNLLAGLSHVRSPRDLDKDAFTAALDDLDRGIADQLTKLEAFQEAIFDAKISGMTDVALDINGILRFVGRSLNNVDEIWADELRNPSPARLAFKEVRRRQSELQDHHEMDSIERPAYDLAELNAELMAEEREGLPADYRMLQIKVKEVFEALVAVSKALRNITDAWRLLEHSGNEDFASKAKARASFLTWHWQATKKALLDISRLGHVYRQVYRWSRGLQVTTFDLMRFKLESPFRLAHFQMMQIIDDVERLLDPPPLLPQRMSTDDRMSPTYRLRIEPLRNLRRHWQSHMRAMLVEADQFVPVTHVQRAMNAKILQSPLWVQEHYRLIFPLVHTYHKIQRVLSALDDFLRGLRLLRYPGARTLEKELKSFFGVLADFAGRSRPDGSSDIMRLMTVDADAIMAKVARRRYDMGLLDPKMLERFIHEHRRRKLVPRKPATAPSPANIPVDLSASFGGNLATGQRYRLSSSTSSQNVWETPDLSVANSESGVTSLEYMPERDEILEEEEEAAIWSPSVPEDQSQSPPLQWLQTLEQSHPYHLAVSNLPPKTTWPEFKDLFRQATLVAGGLYTDIKENGNGIVRFADISDARNAIERFDGFVWNGYALKVEVKRNSPKSFNRIENESLVAMDAAKESHHGPRVLVSNLPSVVDWAELQDLFSQAFHSDVESFIIFSREGRRAVVCFGNTSDARNAIRRFNEFKWKGHLLEVREDPKQDYDKSPSPERVSRETSTSPRPSSKASSRGADPDKFSLEKDIAGSSLPQPGNKLKDWNDETSKEESFNPCIKLHSEVDEQGRAEDGLLAPGQSTLRRPAARRSGSRATNDERRSTQLKPSRTAKKLPEDPRELRTLAYLESRDLDQNESVRESKTLAESERVRKDVRTPALQTQSKYHRQPWHANDVERINGISRSTSPNELNDASDPRAGIAGSAFSPTQPKQAPTQVSSPQSSFSDLPESEVDSMDDTEAEYTPLTYQIPEDELRKAMLTSKTSSVAWWSYDKYRGPNGEKVTMHYCKSKKTSEEIAQNFLGEPVLGCDIEWKSQQPVKADNIKHNVSIIQIACEDRIGLFHLALHKGETIEDILPPTLKTILESPDVLKCGVAIEGDFTRMKKHLGIQPAGLMELSHLHKLVLYGATNPSLVNRRYVGLAAQVLQHLCLPLRKDEVRTSDWSRELNYEQCKYAADDAYASFRVFHALEEKRRALDPMPPIPAFAELKLPIKLAQVVVSESESDESISEGDELLDEQLDDLTLEESESDAESTKSFGENVFDGLTEEELEQLHANAVPVELEDFTQEPLFVLPKPETTSTRVRYPTLPPLYEDQSAQTTRFVGRLKLETSKAPRTSKENVLSATEEPNSEAEESNPEADELRKDLAIQATLWAQQKAISRSQAPSSKSTKPTVTIATLRAYYLWEVQKLDTGEISKVLGLKKSTVSSYIAQCLQFGDVGWSDKEKLRALVKELPYSTRGYYWRIIKEASEAGNDV